MTTFGDADRIFKHSFATSLSYATLAPGDPFGDWASRYLEEEKNIVAHGPAGRRLSHVEVTPVDPERLAAFREFEERWHALAGEGEKAGFLEWEEGWVTREPRDERRTVHDETWDEYQTRIANLKGTIE